MLWLMDRPILGCLVTDKGGLTAQLPDEAGSKETQNEHILYALAGMVGEKNFEVREDLREHVKDPDYFHSETDSYHVVQAIKLLRGDPSRWLVCYEMAVDRLLSKFAKPYREATTMLVEKGMLDFKEIHEMFLRWDEEFFPEGRIKSDVCARAVLKEMEMRVPRKESFGWNLRPLPEGWQQPKRPDLLKIIQMVSVHLQEKNLDDMLVLDGDRR